MSNVNSFSGIDDGQLKNFFIGSFTHNSNARLQHHTVNSSLPDTSDSHGGFWVESSAPPHSDATSHEISHAYVEGSNLELDATGADGTNSFGAQTVDFHQEPADTASSSQPGPGWQINSSQNTQPSNWDGASTSGDAVYQTGHSSVISGSLPIAPDLGTPGGDGIALAQNHGRHACGMLPGLLALDVGRGTGPEPPRPCPREWSCSETPARQVQTSCRPVPLRSQGQGGVRLSAIRGGWRAIYWSKHKHHLRIQCR